MRARGMHGARGKAASQAAEARGLERRRGMIGFLTWAFFLAETLGRDGIGPSSAQASEPDEAPPAHEAADAGPTANDLADRPLTAIGDQGEPTTNISPGFTLSADAGGRAVPLQDIQDRGSQDTPVGYGSVTPYADATGGGVSGMLPAAHEATTQPGTEHPEPTLLLHATLAPEGILHGVADALDGVPLVGNLLGNTVETLASTVDTLLGGLGGLLSSDGSEGAAMASDGSIFFDAATNAAPFHEFETPHGLTDYGIALELGLLGSSVLSLTQPASDVASFVADDDASHLAHPVDHGLPDEAGQRASSDVLA